MQIFFFLISAMPLEFNGHITPSKQTHVHHECTKHNIVLHRQSLINS